MIKKYLPGTRTVTLLLFLAGALIITLIAPRKRKFMYQFVEGKPWQYELLTAPYTFPVYKRAEVLTAERDSVRRNTLPFYNLDNSVTQDKLLRFDEDFAVNYSATIPQAYHKYISGELKRLYGDGIIDAENLKELRSKGRLEVNLLLPQNQVEKNVPISRFSTLEEAYQALSDGLPAGLDARVLQQLKLNNYLIPNVSYNAATSEKVIQDQILQVPLSTGVVQKDERIIDRGQIVDTYTYDVLRSYKQVFEEKSGGMRGQAVISVSLFLMLSVMLGSLWLFLFQYRRQTLYSLRDPLFLLSLMIPLIALVIIAIRSGLYNLYVVPLAILPLMVRTFLDSRTALMAHITMVLCCAVFVSFPFEFILLQSMAGLVVIFSLRSISGRVQLIRTTFLVFLSYVTLTLLISLVQNGTFEPDDAQSAMLFGINLVFMMFSYLLVYLLERAFGYTSNISLVELSDINTPLLKRMSEEAPGTFQHSMQMAILASEAARRIGADSQLIRTGALYHDIGKMLHPSYFTENQGGINPHSELTEKESAAIIIRHITEGVALAKQHKLPKAVIDFIRTHHGVGTTKYFYTQYRNNHPDEPDDPTPFTYPGPNPFTRETAILMMADAVEASSRSLKEYNPDSFRELVDRIVDGIVREGFIDNSPLTFRDVSVIKEVFTEKLTTMYHSRISYPKLNAQAQGASAGSAAR